MKFTREMLEEELCCSICFDLYDKPVMLPCSHNFCGSCIQNLIHHRQKRVERAESPGSVICTINCPTCRRSVSVDTTRIDLLPTNKTLENIVQLFTDTYGDLKKDDVAPPPLIDIDGTEICAAHFQRKTLYCYPCKSWMCIECLEKHQDTCSKGAATFDSRKETCKEDDSSLTSVMEEMQEVELLQSEICLKIQTLQSLNSDVKGYVSRMEQEADLTVERLKAMLTARAVYIKSCLWKQSRSLLKPVEAMLRRSERLEKQCNKLIRDHQSICASSNSENRDKKMRAFRLKAAKFLKSANEQLEVPVPEAKVPYCKLDTGHLKEVINSMRWKFCEN